MKINPGNARGLLVPQGDRPFSFVVYSSEIRDFGYRKKRSGNLCTGCAQCLEFESSPSSSSPHVEGRQSHREQLALRSVCFSSDALRSSNPLSSRELKNLSKKVAKERWDEIAENAVLVIKTSTAGFVVPTPFLCFVVPATYLD